MEPYSHIRTTLDLAERFNSELTQAIGKLSEAQKTANKQQLEKASLLLASIKTSANRFFDDLASIEERVQSELSDLGVIFFLAKSATAGGKWKATTPVRVHLKLIPHAQVNE